MHMCVRVCVYACVYICVYAYVCLPRKCTRGMYPTSVRGLISHTSYALSRSRHDTRISSSAENIAAVCACAAGMGRNRLFKLVVT